MAPLRAAAAAELSAEDTFLEMKNEEAQRFVEYMRKKIQNDTNVRSI